jgi:NAD(P)-dependent dehydrogenase (short-subunit alcohol dehydrogenase family)
VRVNCIAPGFTPTPVECWGRTAEHAARPGDAARRPPERSVTSSDDSAFVSGQTMIVNGGQVPN